MKPILALIIFADGAAAFLGAVLASRIHTEDNKRPAIAKLLMLGLFGYAAARFWQAWNTAEHGREVVECVAVQSADYLWHSYGALTLQACMAWGATIYLILMLMNGRKNVVVNLLQRCADLFRRRK